MTSGKNWIDLKKALDKLDHGILMSEISLSLIMVFMEYTVFYKEDNI